MDWLRSERFEDAFRAGLRTGAAGSPKRQVQPISLAVPLDAGEWGLAISWAKATRFADALLGLGEQQPQALSQALEFGFMAEQAEASLVNDAARITPRANNERQSWRSEFAMKIRLATGEPEPKLHHS